MKNERTFEKNPRIGELVDFVKETNISSFVNGWGPTHVLQIYDPENNIDGIFVIDNTILGPACGPIGMSNTVSPYNTFLNARKMTLSCALLDLGFGGASVNIRIDPLDIDKIPIMKFLARSLSPYIPSQYIAAPGGHVGQIEMAAFFEEIGDRMGVTGKPESMEGIPYELGVLGFGMAVAVEACIDELKASDEFPSDIAEARIAIQGFDGIGYTLGKYLSRKGARIVAISDDWSAICCSEGIDVEKLEQYHGASNEKKSLIRCKDVEQIAKEDFLKTDCDVLVSTTANNLLTEGNINLLNTKCVVEGINNPITSVADQKLNENNIFVIPDILAIAGAPISSYAEYSGKSCDFAFSLIESKIRETTTQLLSQARELGIPPRRMAKEIAKERIMQRMEVVGG